VNREKIGAMLVAAAPLALLYEDASLVMVDKPAGVPVIPAPGWPPEATVQGRAAAQLGGRVWVVHRLDRDTSGVLVLARSAAAHRALSLAFEHRAVQKTYHALVSGVPAPPAGTIDLALHEARRGKTRLAVAGEAGARDARTGYRVVRAWRAGAVTVSRLQLDPATGRHHQIRVHLRALGTPVLGDALYGRGAATLPAEAPATGLALHACALDVPHPDQERRVRAEAPWPPHLAALTDWLESQATVEPVS
jgi:RluA family pseudouridine synthase